MNWKLWIATPMTLGLGLWFAHAVIPHHHADPTTAPTCTEHTQRAERADFADDTCPTLLSWVAPSCDRDVR